jgi:hypothetical protein
LVKGTIEAERLTGSLPITLDRHGNCENRQNEEDGKEGDIKTGHFE